MSSSSPTLFPYFGSKQKVVADVWRRFGEAKAYLEPFAGSLAVLLTRPNVACMMHEVVNDADGFIANFFRALQNDPGAVAAHADYPISAIDLTARHAYLRELAPDFQRQLEDDSEFYDAKIAGLWAWGMSSGRRFCIEGRCPTPRSAGNGLGLHRHVEHLLDVFRALQKRLRYTIIRAGDWRQILMKSFFARGNGITAVFLDPPYSKKSGRSNTKLYRIDDFQVAHDAAKWAIEHGDDHRFRIGFCGLKDEHKFPKSWEEFAWVNKGGRQGTRDRERIWFSPHCLRVGESDPDETAFKKKLRSLGMRLRSCAG